MLTDDAESIMLEVVFGDAPDDVVGLFFGRDDEVFGAGYVEGHGDDEHGAAFARFELLAASFYDLQRGDTRGGP